MAEDSMVDHDDMLEQFCEMSGASEETALHYLQANEWNMLSACNSFFEDENEAKLDERIRKAAEGTLEEYDGPRTLDGRPAPRGDFKHPRQQPKKKGVATLGSMGSARAHGHKNKKDDDDDDDSDDDDDRRRDLFAGGEKSGLAVQDPKNPQRGSSRKIIQDILAKARANATQGGGDEPNDGPARPSYFRGTGMTLGGDGVESRPIPDPLGSVRPPKGPPQERVLHIWQDGFSIDDGELRRFDDPANQMDLKMIRLGRAPLHLMNVDHDQSVDVKLHQHDTPYQAAPKKYKPFTGSGHRLGSPVPGTGNSFVTPEAPVTSAPAASSTSSSAPTLNIDNSQPTLMIRIQLANGTRLPARFNTTHTIRDIYNFIRSASPETRSRAWVLVTTFPNKEHPESDTPLGEMQEFQKGGNVVVKHV